METKVNVELHLENKLNHMREPTQEKETPCKEAIAPPSQLNSNHQPEQRRGEGIRVIALGTCFEYLVYLLCLLSFQGF